MHRLLVVAAHVCLLSLSFPIGADAAPIAPGKLLFRDPFESTALRDGATMTQPT